MGLLFLEKEESQTPTFGIQVRTLFVPLIGFFVLFVGSKKKKSKGVDVAVSL